MQMDQQVHLSGSPKCKIRGWPKVASFVCHFALEQPEAATLHASAAALSLIPPCLRSSAVFLRGPSFCHRIKRIQPAIHPD
jgi:hypothetical protein